ncbi:hypothetical protein CRENBAI_002868 [Crenichthys baileyi]|uniref:Uncharacterized protein n=1 Tax=Crenichthys baileyi TaxID=28760 RepID=A0AAV9R842_9TELE
MSSHLTQEYFVLQRFLVLSETKVEQGDFNGGLCMTVESLSYLYGLSRICILTTVLFPVKAGLHQGCFLSQILFLVFIDGMSSELNRRLPGGYPGWPQWLRVALASLLGPPQEGSSTHTYPTPNSGTSPGWLLPDPDSPETIQPNLSTLHLTADASPALQALIEVTKKSSDLPLSPYSLLLQSESLSSWRISYSL